MKVSLRNLVIATGAAATMLAMPCAARPAELPLWEAGAGIAVLDFPDYRGSDERRTLVLTLPYFVYHGDFLKADRESVRGQINVDFYDRFPGPGWNLGFAAGPLFGNTRHHNYFLAWHRNSPRRSGRPTTRAAAMQARS